MNPKLYRKAALDRLSSPEDLDRMLTITGPRSWLALVGLATFVITAIIWSFVSHIPTKVNGSGVLMGQGGVVNVVTNGDGVVTNFHLKVGDHVRAGQVIANVAEPQIVSEIRQTQNRLVEARVDETHVENSQTESSRLQIVALDRQRTTVEGDIQQGEDMAKLAEQEIAIQQRLLDRGLSTRQDLIAAQQKLVQTKSDIQKNKAQLVSIDAQRFALQQQPEAARRDAKAHVEELDRQLQTLQVEQQLNTQVISPFSGEVVELKVYEGALLAKGTPVMSLQPSVQQLEVVAFIPTSDAKNVSPGMMVQVTPSTVKREEYGYLRGKVSYVSDFPTTSQAAMRTFENEDLVRALKNGVVNEVRIVLERADNTTGYQWSSKKAPPQLISSGTLCTVQVVTQERRPIQLVMPFLKQFFNTE